MDRREIITYRTWITAGTVIFAAYLFTPLKIDMVRQCRTIAVILLVIAIGITQGNTVYWMFMMAVLLYITLMILKDM